MASASDNLKMKAKFSQRPGLARSQSMNSIAIELKAIIDTHSSKKTGVLSSSLSLNPDAIIKERDQRRHEAIQVT
jgi:hypothetical protein